MSRRGRGRSGPRAEAGVVKAGAVKAGVRIAAVAVWAGVGLGCPASLLGQQRASEPVVSIGALDGAEWELLDNVRGLVPLDGAVVIADGGSRQLRHHPISGGPPNWTFGREGEGPGEFQSIGWVDAYRADSLVVWDPWQRRATIVGPDGSLGRTLSLGAAAGAGTGSRVAPAERLEIVAAVPDGRFVARAGEVAVGPGDTTAVRRERFDYVLLSPDGTPERVLVTLPDDEQFVWAEGGSRGVRQRAFARTTAVTATDATLVFATNDGFRVSRMPLDGGAIETREADLPERRVRPEHERSWREANAPPPNAPTFMIDTHRRQMEAMSFPETFPPHGDVVVADDGAIWLEAYHVEGAPTRLWVRFDPAGGEERFTLPPTFSLKAVRDGLVWGVETGEFGVQRVVAYRRAGR